MADPVVMLEVPFEQKDEVKALGARWDRDARCWYVPAGRDVAPFERWFPKASWVGGRVVRAGLMGQGQWCYRCGARGVALAGILVPPRFSVDPSGFVSFDFVARTLGVLVNDTPLAERYNIGRIRLRSSQQRPEGYVANACRACDALFGSFPLQEALTEYLAAGGSYARLVFTQIDFPVLELPYVDSAWNDDAANVEEDDAAPPSSSAVLSPAAPTTVMEPPPVAGASGASEPPAAGRGRRRRRRR